MENFGFKMILATVVGAADFGRREKLYLPYLPTLDVHGKYKVMTNF